MFAKIKKYIPVAQIEVRRERLKFEIWAAKHGFVAGRNEFGYYDDDARAEAAWMAWRDRAFINRLTITRSKQ